MDEILTVGVGDGDSADHVGIIEFWYGCDCGACGREFVEFIYLSNLMSYCSGTAVLYVAKYLEMTQAQTAQRQ